MDLIEQPADTRSFSPPLTPKLEFIVQGSSSAFKKSDYFKCIKDSGFIRDQLITDLEFTTAQIDESSMTNNENTTESKYFFSGVVPRRINVANLTMPEWRPERIKYDLARLNDALNRANRLTPRFVFLLTSLLTLSIATSFLYVIRRSFLGKFKPII
jgi:hypothetical protein